MVGIRNGWTTLQLRRKAATRSLVRFYVVHVNQRLRQSCSDIFTKAFGTNLLQTDVEQIVPVILARAGYERRRYEAGAEGKASRCASKCILI